jgi:signal transduction histidine kinase
VARVIASGKRRGGSLQRRLTLTYTAALALGLVLFSVVSLATIDRILRSTLDARLATTVNAFAATAAGHVGTARLDPALVRRLLDELGIQQNGAIVDRTGKVAMRSGVLPAGVVRFAVTHADDSAAYGTVRVNGGLRVAAMAVAGSGGREVLVVWRPLDVIDDYERIALATFVCTSLVIAVGAYVAGRTVVERGLRPLREMAEVASEIEAHDLSRRLRASEWDDEVGDFARSFDRMLDRLQAAFQRQRQFTADASHDLRAPLSVMRAEADLALARPRGAAEDTASFESIRDEVLELDRLLEALLLSARADAEPIERSAVDLVELADRASVRLRPFASSRSVRIENGVAVAPAIAGDAAILERVLISLIHNGIKFSPPDGTVSLEVRQADEVVSLLVRDQGPGFSENALRFACDRFWKDDSARGRSGTGLGLAIAKSAVERLGGSIVVRNARDGGAEVETSFPRA